MDNYYQQVLDQIRHAMDQKKIDKAQALLEQELHMPYIPSDVEEQFNQLKKELQYRMAEQKKTSTKVDDEELLEMLHGDPHQQVQAAFLLSSLNLRQYQQELDDYLQGQPDPHAAGLLIDAIIEQQIDREWIYRHPQFEYTFYVDGLVPVEKSHAYAYGEKLLQDYVEIHNASIYQYAHSLYISKLYLTLPLTLTHDEVLVEIEQIVQEVCQMIGDEAFFQQFLNEFSKEKVANARLLARDLL